MNTLKERRNSLFNQYNRGLTAVLTIVLLLGILGAGITPASASPGNGDINVQVVDISDGTPIPGSEGARVRLWGPDMSGGTFQGWVQIWKDVDENGWANFTAAEIMEALSGDGPFYYNIDTYSDEGAYSKVVLDGGFWGQFITYVPSVEKTYVVLTPKAMDPNLQVIWNGSNSKLLYHIDLGDRDDSSPDWNWDSLHIENSHNEFPPNPGWGDKPVLMIDWLEAHGYTYDDGGVANDEYCNLTIEKAAEGYSETFVAYKSPDGLSYTIYLACQTEAGGEKENGSYDKINDVYTLTFDPTNVFDPGNPWTESPSLQDGVSYYAVLYVNLKDTPETGLNTVVTPGSVYSLFNPIKGPVENRRTGDRYYSIQAAIEAASAGDTIIVHEGTYAERLTISSGKDGLTLKAAEGENVVLNFSDRAALGLSETEGAIEVYSPSVTIQGFRIIGYDITGEPWSDQRSSANFPTIKAFSDADGLRVIGNEFVLPEGSAAAAALLLMDYCEDVKFIDNEVAGYVWGVTGRGESIHNLLVQGNTFNIPIIEGKVPWAPEHDDAAGVGVQLWHGNNLTVIDNVFIGSFDQATGDYTDPDALCNHYAVSTFTTYFSSAYGMPDIVGDIYIRDNEMSNLYLGVGSFAGGGEIESNSIYDNVIGIQLGQVSGAWATAPTAGLNITGNSITDNTRGVWVQSIVADGVSAKFNNIVGNAEYGVINEDPENDLFNATHNWWGDPEGPTVGELILVAYGLGDRVSDYVDFEPWLTVPLMDDPDGTGVIASSQFGTDTTLEFPDSNVEVEVSGSAEVYVTTYESNPGADFMGDIGNYIDVYVPDTSGLTELEIRKYYTDEEIEALDLDESSLSLYWWNGADWVECSDTGVNTAENYIWAVVNDTTTPNLTDLRGTPFGAAGRLPVGGVILPVDKISLISPWLLLAAVIASGALLTIRKQHL